eukprot:scaffold1320_cov113-Isochrysis_galbana.AAC.5
MSFAGAIERDSAKAIVGAGGALFKVQIHTTPATLRLARPETQFLFQPRRTRLAHSPCPASPWAVLGVIRRFLAQHPNLFLSQFCLRPSRDDKTVTETESPHPVLFSP